MPADNYQQLYEFERLISATLVGMFNADDLATYGVGTAPEFQKSRPRVEVFITIGSRFDNHYRQDAQGNRRENGWSGSFILTALTAADFTIHSLYIAAIRNKAALLDQIDLGEITAANPVTLDWHEISEVKTAGTAPTTEPEKGYYETKLNYDFIFNIRPDAWPGQ